MAEEMSMALSPEVLFHLYFQNQLSPVDRENYRGKQDLDRLEPELRSLLTNVQNTLNEALRRRGHVFARGCLSNFHFDYVDAEVPNALAFEYEDYAFIAVTMPLITVLARTCNQLSRSAKVTEVLRTAATEQQREAILAELFTTQLTFVVSHEFAHHDRGHFLQRDSATGFWDEILAVVAEGSLEEQAQEVEADRWAVYLVLTNLMTGERREGVRGLLGHRGIPDDSVDEILLSSFIIAVAAFFFVREPDVCDERTIYKLTHPPQAARMHEVMRNVQDWCKQNRPALEAWMTLARFQVLMHAVEEASSGTDNWSQQTAFFLTNPGAEYIRRLEEHVVSRVSS
jgi:hypothetical protein